VSCGGVDDASSCADGTGMQAMVELVRCREEDEVVDLTCAESDQIAYLAELELGQMSKVEVMNVDAWVSWLWG
jgi:hypothetical protein